MTREQLAARLDINWRTLVRWEKDETERISYLALVEIASATGKPISYFVGKKAAA